MTCCDGEEEELGAGKNQKATMSQTETLVLLNILYCTFVSSIMVDGSQQNQEPNEELKGNNYSYFFIPQEAKCNQRHYQALGLK